MKEFRSKLNYVWQYLSRPLTEFKVALLGYRTYTALLTQIGTDPPTFEILENTLGFNIQWTMVQPGEYYGIIPDGFVENKTACFGTPNAGNDGFIYFVLMDVATYDPTKRIVVYTQDVAGSYVSTGESPATIEIRIYNR